jgi:hypothetical protein
MSRAEFQLAYDGPALRSGSMDVTELASSLLAVGDLIQDANRVLNGDRAEVSVRVKSDFKKGSFEVALLLDHSLLEQAKNLLFPAGATIGGAAIIKLLFGTEIGKKGVSGVVDNVLDLWKKLRSEKPKEVIKDEERGLTIFVIGNNNNVSANQNAARLYDQEAIRSAIGGIVRPVSKRGIRSLEIKRGKKVVNSVQKADLPPVTDEVDSGENKPASVKRDTRETTLRVTRANFEKGKWGFSDGAASFSADITDEGFREKLDSREIGFYKGDTLRVLLTVTQIVSEGQAFHTTYEIERVIDHIHAPRQQPLLPPSAKQHLIE